MGSSCVGGICVEFEKIVLEKFCIEVFGTLGFGIFGFGFFVFLYVSCYVCGCPVSIKTNETSTYPQTFAMLDMHEASIVTEILMQNL